MTEPAWQGYREDPRAPHAERAERTEVTVLLFLSFSCLLSLRARARAHTHTQTHRCIFQYNLIEHHFPCTFTWPCDSDTPVKCGAHIFSQVLLRRVWGGVNIAEMVPPTLGQGVNTQDTSRISLYPADGIAALQ